MEMFKAEFKKIAIGLAGSEGPVFSANDNKFYMVAPEVEVNNKPAGQVLHVDLAQDKVDVVCEPSVDGYGGIPAGCQMDKQGKIWVADMRLGLLKIDPSLGNYEQICKVDSESRVMQGCNDCVFDCYGNLWLTAPAGSIAPGPYQRSMQEGFGSVYCYTKSGIMKRIDTGYRFCNGIAIQYDECGVKPENLIVAETPTKTLWSMPIVYDSDNQGSVDVTQKKIFGHCMGDHEGGPDGMDFDCEGNLLVANWGSGYIDVFNKAGGHPYTRIELPFKRVSNLHFRPATRDVYVTEHDEHGLWHFQWLHIGAKHYCEL